MSEQNAITTADSLAKRIPLKAPVVVTLIDSDIVKPELRGAKLYGFWLGIIPNPKVNKALLSADSGWHWIAHVADVRSDDLVYDLHLAIIENIDVNAFEVAKERAS